MPAQPLQELDRDQALGRSQRLGQERIVKVIEYVVNGSFNNRQLSNNLTKSAPGLIADLSDSHVNVDFNAESGTLDLGFRVRNKNDNILGTSE
jgi:hypothetical protein